MIYRFSTKLRTERGAHDMLENRKARSGKFL
jgi:hypothetical protein